MNSELSPSENISKFVSVGPKKYAYIVLTGDSQEKNRCKGMGINLA